MPAFRKLISMRRTLLGTVTFPDDWVTPLRETGTVTFDATTSQARHERLRSVPLGGHGVIAPVPLGSLRQHYGSFTDCVELCSITLEHFEQIPGCSFAPGAGYLRSLMEDE